MLAARVGASLIAALALLAGSGCAGSDDVEPSGRIVMFDSLDAYLIPAGGGKRERLKISDYEFLISSRHALVESNRSRYWTCVIIQRLLARNRHGCNACFSRNNGCRRCVGGLD